MDEKSILKEIQTKAQIWKNLEPKNISLKRMHALTNVVFRVRVETGKVKNGEPSKVIYKIFNARAGIKALIDRKQENAILKVSSDAELGPHLYYVDDLIRIEEFLEGQDYTYKDMIDSKRQIVLVYTLTLFQKLQPDFPKEDIFGKLVVSGLLNKLVIDKIKDTEFDSEELKLISKVQRFLSHDRMEELYEEMKKDNSPLVLSHNDLLNGNILKFREKFSKLILIDYEYSGYNFRGYDIANYCNECMIDYSEETLPGFIITKANRPSDSQLRDLFRYYILFRNTKEFKLNDHLVDSLVLEEEWAKNPKLEEELSQMTALHNYYLIASHVIWIYWAIVSAKGVNKSFDYIEFARQRFEDAKELAGVSSFCNLL